MIHGGWESKQDEDAHKSFTNNTADRVYNSLTSICAPFRGLFSGRNRKRLELLSGFPGCCRAIDGTFMHINKPIEFGDACYCYKQYPALLIFAYATSHGLHSDDWYSRLAGMWLTHSEWRWRTLKSHYSWLVMQLSPFQQDWWNAMQCQLPSRRMSKRHSTMPWFALDG